MDALSHLDALAPAEARAEFRRCCGSARWVERMTAARPFLERERLFAIAEDTWNQLDPEDWREAFAHHPKIGDKEALRARFADTRQWALGEQAGAAQASEEVLEALAQGNQAYEARFGHIFIVCATGKTAAEMLALLRERLGNDPEAELRIAAREQARITRLRLEKLLAPS
ncbi:MAG TPA: 2-oxo-4-hydroxy-4-carboxy-5-ureidoimidazoline decarboxylase [Vicinamibacteria bacterium]